MDSLNVFMNKGLFGLVSSPGFQKFSQTVTTGQSSDNSNSFVAFLLILFVISIISIGFLILCYVAIGKIVPGSSQKCNYYRIFLYVLVTLNLFFFPMVPVALIILLMWAARVKICN